MTDKEAPEWNIEIEMRAKALFDESVAALDARICSRLTQARYTAVRELEKRRTRRIPRAWMPAAGLAAAAISAVALLLPNAGDDGNAPVAALPDVDMVILLGEDNLEFLEEMEFYAWLDRESGAFEAQHSAAEAEPRRS